MLYLIAVTCFGVALVLGTLNLLGVTPGAAGVVSLALMVGLGLLAAKGLANFSHHHRRHANAHH
jgi:hypothetical protein